MARREITQYFDDLDNSSLNEDDVRIMRFGFDGIEYVLDLPEDNAQEFNRLMAPYIAGAREVTVIRTLPHESMRTHDSSRTIRRWAKEHGIKVSNRGKIPHKVIEAYDNSHS